MTFLPRFCGVAVFACALASLSVAGPVPLPSQDNPVKSEALDGAAFAEWVEGQEHPLTGPNETQSPKWVVWTDKGHPGHSFVTFGASHVPGPRHLRIGFTAPVAVGSVLARGGGSLSVLKPGAAYPGDLGKESDWVAAERVVEGQVSHAEAGREDYALWVLPPHTQTRALRFTHVAGVVDPDYAGALGGVSVMAGRFGNLAPLGSASASGGTQFAGRINDGSANGTWRVWENMEKRTEHDDALPVTAEHPQWVLLTWPEPVSLGGLEALFPGFAAAEAQAYTGPADRHPRDAAESDWKTVGTFEGLKNGYPVPLWPNAMMFPAPVTTRAIRVKMTAPTQEEHPHMKGNTNGGRRVWLGELVALQPLHEGPLQAVRFAAPRDEPHAPIPVRFTLAKPGYVTLVVEDAAGLRVRNLVSETPFPAGENTAWWDGTDDLGRDPEAAKHGLYQIPARFVTPGAYRVRGLVRGEIEPHYEFPVYHAGQTAWSTADGTGAWLANHTPPQAALFVPGEAAPGGQPLVYLGSYVSEGRDGLAWVDLEGHKLGGEKWVGGNWTGAPYLARDEGSHAVPGVFGYAASVWSTAKGSAKAEVRITALTAKGDKPVLRHEYDPQNIKELEEEISGFAVRDSVAAVSLPRQKTLLLANAGTGEVMGKAALDDPRGLAFDKQGRFLVLAGHQLLRFASLQAPLPKAETVVAGLEDPQQLTLDAQGNFYISDRGASHQVKVFDAKGKPVRAIGHAGAPKAGPYDPLHLNNPAGLAIDAKAHLWITENDYLPKRVSVWTLSGELVKAFYGPGKYGGGGTLDAQDKTRFYYAEETRGAMELKLDWKTGESQVASIYSRRQPGDQPLAFRAAAPENALYHEGRRYFTDCYNSSPTSGHDTAYLFQERDGVAHPVAAMGRALEWEVLKGDAFRARYPAKFDEKARALFFIWSDTNGDGQVQSEEVTFQPLVSGGVTVMPDLAFCVARVGDKVMRFAPTFSSKGIPAYDFSRGETLLDGVKPPSSSGGDQVLTGLEGWTVVTLGSGPFDRLSLSGGKKGVSTWSYPSPWPGLHASHEAPSPDRPGELIGTTRLLGGAFTPKGSTAGPLWAVNSNMGHFYIFTADGLFVATVFEDARQGKSLSTPTAERNMNLQGITLHDENFWPTITQTADGQVYAVDGGNMILVRLDGLDTVQRLPDTQIRVTPADLQSAQTYLVAHEAARQKNQGRGILEVPIKSRPPTVDGQLDDWDGAAWVDIDKRGVAANFNSNSKPYDVTGALAISGDRLYAAWRTGDDKLLQNTGELATAPFKTGGALDLMLAVNPKADPKRGAPVEGDLRLLITQVKGKTRAVLYRAVVPGTKSPVPFSSPARTITLDRADDVSEQVQLAGAHGNYEMSVPLSLLGLAAQPGQKLAGDMGILRGNGFETTARIYWSNKATGITADVPSEAMLTPQLWGEIKVVPASR